MTISNSSKSSPRMRALYVLVEPADPAHPPPTARWTAFADALDARLSDLLPKYIYSVETRVRPSEMGPYGLLFADPKTLPETLESFKDFARLLKTLGEKPGIEASVIGNTPVERFYQLHEPVRRFPA